MRSVSYASAAPQGTSRQSWTGVLAAGVKRWWAGYLAWRREQAAAAQLWSMSERELRDIGLARSEIENAVRGEMAGDRAFHIRRDITLS